MTLAVLAVALGGAALWCHGSRRRRRLLREAAHELRRPLAALLLLAGDGPREAALREQVEVALADLDAALRGRRCAARRRDRLPLSRVIAEARARWAGAGVRFGAGDPGVHLEVDRVHLGMALDNLIANGLEHGSGRVEVEARRVEGGCRLEVRNGSWRQRADLPPDPLRGHGLRIAAREAANEGGRLDAPQQAGRRVVAALELPRARNGAGGT